MLVIFRGLPGTGKSYLAARFLEKRPSFLVVSRDTLRAGIIPHPDFSESEKGLVDDLVVTVTAFLLERKRDVLIDGMALSSATRVEQLAGCAETRGQPVAVIECVCAETTALARIKGDATHPAGDRGEPLYRAVKKRFQTVDRPTLVVDTDGETARTLAAVLDYVDGRAAG
ncbi:MAG TPA: AAA family ATPase [Spirochaetia bacterium]